MKSLHSLRRFLVHPTNLVSDLLSQIRFHAIRRAHCQLRDVYLIPRTKINGRLVIRHHNVVIRQGTWVGCKTEFDPAPCISATTGKNCDVSQDILFGGTSHEIGDLTRRAGTSYSLPITICGDALIGTRVIFLGGSKVSDGCITGARDLVRRGISMACCSYRRLRLCLKRPQRGFIR
jgi:acetyltransferase-like isoleucine patch superfamily enzyme